MRVAKHGNRSVSSRCGSADVFEALGVGITAPPDGGGAQPCDQAGVAFLFAPSFHPAMKHAAPTRKELGLRTAFNLLGPLTNPAAPSRQIVGVPRPELTELVARALLMLGSERVWVVHGADGLDEISTTGYTKVSEGHDGTVRTFHVHPGDFGLKKTTLAAMAGGDARTNARILVEMLRGQPGPVRDIVLLNAGAGLFVAGRAGSVREGIALAAAAVDGGTRPPRARGAGAGDHRGADRHERRGPATCSARSSRPREARVGSTPRRVCRRPTSSSARSRLLPPTRGFRAALAAPGVRVIAECKRRSPSRGVLRADYDPVAIARRYAEAGAAAISVLTEPTFFDGVAGASGSGAGGRWTCRCSARTSSSTSTSCSRRARRGADAVLLIVAALDDAALGRLSRDARALGLDVLVEVHDEAELDRALAAGADLIGVNNRNLRTLAVDVDASVRLAAAHAGRRDRGGGERPQERRGRQAASGSRATARFSIGERFMTRRRSRRRAGRAAGGAASC